MFNFLQNIFKKKERVMPERVAQANKLLPDSIKNLSTPQLATKINKMNAPNKWAITRMAASGRLHKTTVGGNHYPPGYMSKARQERRQKQIEKGIIQVTPDREYKSSKPQPQATQEAT